MSVPAHAPGSSTDLGRPAPQAEPPLTPTGRHTLARRLVVRVVILTAVVSLLLSLAAVAAASRVMTSQLDQQLSAAASRIEDRGPRRTDDRRSPGSLVILPGMSIGTIVYERDKHGDAQAQMLVEGGPGKRLSTADLDVLGEAADTGAGLRTIDLPTYGHYRVLSFQTDGSTTLVGLPMASVERGVGSIVRTAALLTLVALLVAIVVSRALVVRSLAPLNRLAATATRVSQMNLERGDVDLAVRVAATDAEADNEVGRVGRAFNHMLANVEGALASRQASETKVRQFVADASHELRNPLASIRGYAELTRRHRDALPEDTAFAMTRIESESARMSRLVEDLLLLARLDADQTLTRRPTDLTEVVLNAVSDARAAGPQHSWTLDLPAEPLSVPADPHRLHQVVVNLLANARTHTPTGTTVHTRLAVVDGMAELTVHDNGPGIPSDIAPRVFERFTRAEESRVRRSPTGSTGLGLAIVAAVVEAHQGSASVRSVPGDTTFTVRLPLAPAMSR